MTLELKVEPACLQQAVRKAKELDKKLDEILPEAFAVVREAGKRVLGQSITMCSLLAASCFIAPDCGNENR